MPNRLESIGFKTIPIISIKQWFDIQETEALLCHSDFSYIFSRQVVVRTIAGTYS